MQAKFIETFKDEFVVEPKMVKKQQQNSKL